MTFGAKFPYVTGRIIGEIWERKKPWQEPRLWGMWGLLRGAAGVAGCGSSRSGLAVGIVAVRVLYLAVLFSDPFLRRRDDHAAG